MARTWCSGRIARTIPGKRVVVTRAPHQTDELVALLHAQGAIAIRYPCIDIAPPTDRALFTAALRRLTAGEFDWLALTSANAVTAVARELNTLKLAPADFHRAYKVAAVGNATAAAVRAQFGFPPDFVPSSFRVASLVRELPLVDAERVLAPRSDIADQELAEAFDELGPRVTVVAAYQTVVGSGGDPLWPLLLEGTVDAITFTSPSTVHNLLQRLRAESGETQPAILKRLDAVAIACLGSTTANAARHAGLWVAVQPNEQTLPGLLSALVQFLAEAGKGADPT